MSPDSCCCHFVHTRLCRPAKRIKVVLVGEDLGPVTAGENCCGACAYGRKHCEAFYEKLNLLMIYCKEEIQFENKGISPRKWGK